MDTGHPTLPIGHPSRCTKGAENGTVKVDLQPLLDRLRVDVEEALRRHQQELHKCFAEDHSNQVQALLQAQPQANGDLCSAPPDDQRDRVVSFKNRASMESMMESMELDAGSASPNGASEFAREASEMEDMAPTSPTRQPLVEPQRVGTARSNGFRSAWAGDDLIAKPAPQPPQGNAAEMRVELPGSKSAVGIEWESFKDHSQDSVTVASAQTKSPRTSVKAVADGGDRRRSRSIDGQIAVLRSSVTSASLSGDPRDIRSSSGWKGNLLRQNTETWSGPMGLFRRRSLRSNVRRQQAREQTPLWKFTHSYSYEVLRAFVSLFDVIIVILEMEHARSSVLSDPAGSTSGVRDDVFYVAMSDLIGVLFATDLALRALADGFDLSMGADLGWRWFNISVVTGCWLQMFAHHYWHDQRSSNFTRVVISSLSAGRIFRVLQIVQVTEAIRSNSFFHELRVMVNSILHALKSFMWSAAMITLICTTFGIVFAEGALHHQLLHLEANAPGPDDERAAALWRDFSSVLEATLSLFQAMSGGRDWAETYHDISALGSSYSFIFVMFISFAFIAVLNIVTAVFVESMMLRSQSDREFMVQAELNSKKRFLATMKNVFQELDKDETGFIELNELSESMKDAKIGAYFSKLGVDTDQVVKLFNLLDQDKSGSIDEEEFIFGCLKLHGEAKSLDLAMLQAQLTKIQKIIVQMGQDMAGAFVSGSATSLASPPGGDLLDRALSKDREASKKQNTDVSSAMIPGSMSAQRDKGAWTYVAEDM